MGELHRIAHELGPQQVPATDHEDDDQGSRRALAIVSVLLLILGFVVLVAIGTNADHSGNAAQETGQQSGTLSDEQPERAPAAVPAAPLAQTDDQRSAEIIGEITYLYVQSAYAGFGQQLSPAQWGELSRTVCDDMASGGPGLYTSGAVSGLPEIQMDTLAKASWNALAADCYPASHSIPAGQEVGVNAFLIHLASFHNAQAAVEGLDVQPLAMPAVQQQLPGGSGSGESGGYTPYGGSGSSGYSGSNGSGSRSTSPYSGGSSGGGYRVQCNDGTYSNSGGKQGACSWHGGTR